jgi:hypothetical protein
VAAVPPEEQAERGQGKVWSEAGASPTFEGTRSHVTICAARFAVLLLCIAAVPASAAADGAHLRPGREETTPTYTLATLTLHQARRLHGKRARFRIEVDSTFDEIGKFDVYGCQGEDDRFCTVWFPARPEVADEMVVEALLVVIHHKGWTAPNGFRFDDSISFRLTRARRCK